MSTNLVLVFHIIPSKDWFKDVLNTLKKIYKFISIKDIEAYYNGKRFNNCCHITFDDGEETVYTNAFPVLKEMNIPATLFISPKNSNYWFQELKYLKENLSEHSTIPNFFSLVSLNLNDIWKIINTIKKKYNINIDKRYSLTKNQLQELRNSDLITIGAHTVNHPILSNENETDARQEIEKSIKDLDTKYFAYPNGINGLDFGQREQLILKENNIKLSFAVKGAFFNQKTNPLNIPRMPVGFENSKKILIRVLFLLFWNNQYEIKERKKWYSIKAK